MKDKALPNLDRERAGVTGPWRAVAFALAIVGVAVLTLTEQAGGVETDARQRFWAAYLVNFGFYLSLSLGALFFVALQHLVRAGWSVGVRRLAELVAANLIWMGLLFLPILFSGRTFLYSWMDPSVVAGDKLLEWKEPYLNVPFFTARAVGYFVVWGLLAWFFLRQSSRQDASGDPALTRRMEKLAPGTLLLFALTVTFAAFDWFMSLEPHWFSTIYGVYYFAGAIVGAVAVLVLLAAAMQAGGWIHGAITVEHYHELGKLLLGFVVFWGYIAFSQYMLIWYANIPEESVWYLARQSGPWLWCSVALLVGNLFVPFLGLLPREVKRRRITLGAWAVWLLVFHWLDLYWLVMPTFSPASLPFGWPEAGCLVGMGCLFAAGIVHLAARRALAPVGDPRMNESLAYENLG
ncbi:MAG: quinol:cytochrome C oxidoreductase [Pirellulales bacterium]|nr:quinol:cytochrome C oxidoreductase [Pirellulales bacterium]